MIGAWLWWGATAAWAACTVITGAEVHTPMGVQKGRTVVLSGDEVAAVGLQLSGLTLDVRGGEETPAAAWQGVPCEVVQGAGKVLTPGIVAVDSQIGLVEVGMEEAANEADPHTADAVRAALVATDAYDPRRSTVGVNRTHGVTHAIVSPGGGGIVQGQVGAVRLSGARQAEVVLAEAVAMSAGMPSRSWAEALRQLRELMADVRAYAADPAGYRAGRLRPLFPEASALDLAALVPVARGEVPVVVTADRAAEIEALLRVADELGLSLVIRGAAEGHLVADALAEAEVPVIVDPLVYGPGSFDQVHGRPDNAALLHQAGVSVLLSAGSSHNARVLRQSAGNAVRGGLPHAAALHAITAEPARVFGQKDRGELAVGRIANVVVWSGDPLELTTQVEHVIIEGRSVGLQTRQTELLERYRTLPGSPLPALPLPE